MSLQYSLNNECVQVSDTFTFTRLTFSYQLIQVNKLISANRGCFKLFLHLFLESMTYYYKGDFDSNIIQLISIVHQLYIHAAIYGMSYEMRHLFNPAIDRLHSVVV